MENEREPTQFEADMSELIAGVLMGTARAIAALTEAVAKQPKVDRTQLLDDMFSALPLREDAGPLEAALFDAMDGLLTTPAEQPPHSPGG